MKLTFPTKYKAQVLAKLEKARVKFEKADRHLTIQITPNDSEQHTFFVDIIPEKDAKYVEQYLSDFIATDSDLNVINQYISESLDQLLNISKTNLDKK